MERPLQLGPQASNGSAAHDEATPGARSANQINALIHLYRAEMGRLTAFRTRLDTTTSWTVTTATIVTTFGLTNKEVPESAFLFVMFAVFFFLHLEARRYRSYEASRYKILLLERYFYPEMLGFPVDPAWTDRLVEALRSPHRQLNYLGALGWRLRRNYLWLYIAVFVIWLGKLHLKGEPSYDVSTLVSRATIDGIPGWLVFCLVGVFYAGLIAIAVGAHRIYPLGDEQVQDVLKASPAD